MNNTEYLKLKKPEPSDFYNVEDMNDNSDAIDAAVKALNDFVGDVKKTGVFISADDESVNIPDVSGGCGCDMPFKLGIDENGNYGYYKAGEDTLTPFSSGTGGGVSYQSIDTDLNIKPCTVVNEEEE